MKLITIYNNEEILKAGLLASHKQFLNNTDIIGVNNCDGQFESFADAMASILTQLPKDEPIIITHQDVQFYENDTYNLLKKYLPSNNLSIFLYGLVGVNKFTLKAEEAGVNPIICAGKQINYRPITKPTSVESIDECVIITNRNTIENCNLFMDKRLKWHLYAVDACLQMQRSEQEVYVIPVPINHLSSGKFDREYICLSLYLLNKYNRRHIYTTNLHISRTNILIAYFKTLVKDFSCL